MIGWVQTNKVLVTSGFVIFVAGNSSSIFSWECPIHRFFGLYCPGCGATRALGDLFQLDLVSAVQQNLLIFVSPALIGLTLFLQGRSKLGFRVFLFLTVVSIFTFTLLRNLPNSPLAPS
jgi:hypothetical protein